MMTSFLAARFLSLLTVFIVDCQILKRAFYSGYQDTVYFLQQSSEFLSDFITIIIIIHLHLKLKLKYSQVCVHLLFCIW